MQEEHSCEPAALLRMVNFALRKRAVIDKKYHHHWVRGGEGGLTRGDRGLGGLVSCTRWLDPCKSITANPKKGTDSKLGLSFALISKLIRLYFTAELSFVSLLALRSQLLFSLARSRSIGRLSSRIQGDSRREGKISGIDYLG